MNEDNNLQDVQPTPIQETPERVNNMSGFGFSAPEPVFAPPVPVPAAPTPKLPAFNDPKPKPKKKRKTVPLGAFIAIVAIFSVLLSCAGASMYVLFCYCAELKDNQDALSSYYNDLENINSSNAGKLNDLEDKINGLSSIDSTSQSGKHLTPSQVYAMNVNAVVYIQCASEATIMSGYSTGSGFIVSEDGYIYTNAHVVEGADLITIRTYAGQELPAELVGTDNYSDVALLKVDAVGLPHVTLGSSANVAVGEQVVAIGNPLGELDYSLTVGYISAKDRIVNNSSKMIQTDVAINSGNSGGPLFNMAGEVIGITSAKYSGESSTGATIEGIGFAIPIDDVIVLGEELKENGNVSYAYLGVSVQDVNPNPSTGSPAGACVVETFEGYAAAESGIAAGDIIIKVNDTPVTSIGTLTIALKSYKPGDQVTVVVFRNGTEVAIDVTLDERPAD